MLLMLTICSKDQKVFDQTWLQIRLMSNSSSSANAVAKHIDILIRTINKALSAAATTTTIATAETSITVTVAKSLSLVIIIKLAIVTMISVSISMEDALAVTEADAISKHYQNRISKTNH